MPTACSRFTSLDGKRRSRARSRSTRPDATERRFAMSKEVVPVKKQEVSKQEMTRPGRAYLPNVDIAETEDSLWLWADMPGVDDKSIDVNLEKGVLTVEGRVQVG